jgi:hypothetical protein
MNDDLERMWNEAVVTYFKVVTSYLCGGTEEDQVNLEHNLPPAYDLIPGPPELLSSELFCIWLNAIARRLKG